MKPVKKKKEYNFRAILEANELFGGLGLTTLDKLASMVRIVQLPAGKVLFSEGDTANGCFCIVSGVVKVSLLEVGGEETLICILGKNDIIGEMALVDRLPRSASVTALKESELGLISTRDFERLADADTEIYRHLLRVLSGRLRAANDQKANQQRPLESRLAAVLLGLSDGFGERLPDGRMMIRQRFSQTQLGQMANCARENVNRQMAAWTKAKLLSKVSNYYCLNDIPALRRQAKG